MTESILTHLLWSTVTAALTLGAVWLLRKQSASLRCLILLFAVARFAVPTAWFVDAGASLGVTFPSFANLVAPVPAVSVKQAAEEVVAANQVAPVIEEQTEVPAELSSSEEPIRDMAPVTGAATPSPGIPWTTFAGVPWAAGVFVVAWIAWRRSRTRWAAVREPNTSEREALWLAAEKVGTRTIPTLRIVDRYRVPSARGWWNATVLLPDGLSEELSAEELDAVLAHEAAHLKRLDNLWGTAVMAITALFWFHPLVWILRHRFYVERETACDEMVLAAGATPDGYANAIAKVCRYAAGLGAPSYLTASIGGANLKQRLDHILRAGPLPRSRWSTAAAAMLVVAATLIVPVKQGLAQSSSDTTPSANEASTDHTLLDFYRQELERAYPSGISDPSSWPDEMVRGMYLTEIAHDFAGGIEAFQKLVAQNPQEPRYRTMLGNVYVRTESYDDALQEYDAELSLLDDPLEQAKVWFKKGETLRRADNYEDAMNALREAIRLNPEDTGATLQLALFADMTRHEKEATELYERLLELDPENVVMLNNLAYKLVEQGGNPLVALDYAERAHQLRPDNAEIQDTLGYVQLKNGKVDAAIQTYVQVLSKEFDRASFQSRMVAALGAKSSPSAAEVELRQLFGQVQSPDRDDRIHELLREIGQ